MTTSVRFAVGVHLLTALAVNPGKILRSEDVADSANTNPSWFAACFAHDDGRIDQPSARSWRRFRIGAAGERHPFAPCLRSGGKRRTHNRAPVAAERILSGRRPIPPVLREAVAPAVEALEEKLSRTTNDDIAGAVLARRKEPRKRRRLLSARTPSDIA
jgi:hypothetical protein